MQAPTVLRESLVGWRRNKLGNLLEKGLASENQKLEKEFLSTLPFYWTVKDKVLSPLLTMQVRE